MTDTVEDMWPFSLPMPPSSLALLPRQMLPLDCRNVLIDRAVYGTGALTPDEQAFVLGLPQEEAAVIVVPPLGSGQPIEIVPRPFRRLRDLPCHGIAIAGFGGSTLGAAVLARAAADHVGQPVGGLVRGHDILDLMSEAAGGWCRMRVNDLVGSSFELTRRMLESFQLYRPRDPAGATVEAQAARIPDSRSLEALLCLMPERVRFLIGHSKGCRAIASALNGIAISRPELAERLAGVEIVTLGVSIRLAPVYCRLFQVRGSADLFGRFNSEAAFNLELPTAGHHLNRALPFALPVDQALAAVPAGWGLRARR